MGKIVILHKLNRFHARDAEDISEGYFKIRNAAWQFLIESEISFLPVDPKKELEKRGITTLSFAETRDKLAPLMDEEYYDGSCDSFTIFIDGKAMVVYNEELSIAELNFALAHELGHIVLQHYQNNGSVADSEADAFAIRALSPICVLDACKVENGEEVAALCEIPQPLAATRYKRLEALRSRGKILSTPLERKAFSSFEPFVKGYLDYYKK